MKKTNAQLRRENTKLEKAFEMKARENTLAQLMVGAANAQNITSFNTIIENNINTPLTLLWTVLTSMYKTHGIIQTAVEMPVLDALRGGIDIESGQLDEDEIGELQDVLERTNVLGVVGEAFNWARLFGGAALIVNTDQDYTKPLNLNRINRLSFYAADRWELQPSSGYMESEFYDYYEKRIHHSRVLLISGKRAPRWIRQQLAGWGMSEVERIVEDFNKYLKTNNVLYELLEEAKIDVFKMQGLNDQLVSEAGTNDVLMRITAINKLKNFNHALILDKDDDYEQKQISFAGLAEVMAQNRIGIASACQMPQAKIFGLSAQGFGSGEDDIENYNALVESQVRSPMKQILRLVLQIQCAQLFGLPNVDISFKFKPLRILGAVEEENVKKSKQDRILGWQTAGNYTREEAAKHAAKDGLILEHTEAESGLLDEFGNPNEPEPEPGKEGGDKGGGDE